MRLKRTHVTQKPSVQFWLENHPAQHLAGTKTNHDVKNIRFGRGWLPLLKGNFNIFARILLQIIFEFLLTKYRYKQNLYFIIIE